MLTLSAILLEDRENLFLYFWSPFSISFNRFSARQYILKKVSDLTRPCPLGTLTMPAL